MKLMVPDQRKIGCPGPPENWLSRTTRKLVVPDHQIYCKIIFTAESAHSVSFLLIQNI